MVLVSRPISYALYQVIYRRFDMKKSDKKKRWIRFRHKIVRNVLNFFLKPYCYLKYGLRVERLREKKKRQYLILFNHQTGFDQFFVGMAFRGAVYYVASEDIFSMGKASSLIRYLVAPIPIKKQATDVRAVIDGMKVAREGGTIAIAPEGNRTFSGENCYMNPAIAMLAKKLSLPIALYRIEGGYGVHPRWSDVVRKGHMRAYVSRVIEPEEYTSLSDTELCKLIGDGLYINDCESGGKYYSKKSAEYLERAFYVCPYCGLAEFHSEGEKISCKRCGRSVKYLSDLTLSGEGFDFPFKNTVEWYNYQCDYVRGLDLSPYTDTPMFTDTATLSLVALYKKKEKLCEAASVKLYSDKITVSGSEEFSFPFDEVSAVSVLGKNKVNIYHGKKVYQLKGDERMNALKYVNVYYSHKSIDKGDENGKFLGL